MESHACLLGTWELDPTCASDVPAMGCFLKFENYSYTLSASNNGRSFTIKPETLAMTCWFCLPINYKEGMQVVT